VLGVFGCGWCKKINICNGNNYLPL